MGIDLKNKELTTRKHHRCDWCGEGIHKGTRANYRCGVYEGDFFTEFMHLECYKAFMVSDLEDNEYSPMEQKRGVAI